MSVLRFLAFCNVLHTWECPGHPILIESTDFMIAQKIESHFYDWANFAFHCGQ